MAEARALAGLGRVHADGHRSGGRPLAQMRQRPAGVLHQRRLPGRAPGAGGDGAARERAAGHAGAQAGRRGAGQQRAVDPAGARHEAGSHAQGQGHGARHRRGALSSPADKVPT
ncbi:MAG: hypothetical protein EOP35_03325 [Rubrivivax sp.]|nr:MAG: hypothetical protein EOP35_03325 [Rubrivivax sp.]